MSTTPQSLLLQVLRIHDEPYRYFDDWQVHQRLTVAPKHYLDHLLAQLESLANGESRLELPHKLVFSDDDRLSDFRVMPCVVHHPDRVRKTVKLVGTNSQQQVVADQITVGKAFAIDADENFVSAGFAGCLLSSARTGACVATAVRLLADAPRRVAITGSGRVGYYAALYIASLGKTEEIFFSDTVVERAENTATLLQQDFPDIRVGTSAKTEGADVVVLATDSQQPIYGDGASTAPLVVSVGADTHWQHEVSDKLAEKMAICVDTLDSFNYGDLRQWIKEEKVEQKAITDLLGLLRETKKRAGPTLFISTGSALFDNLTIDYLLQQEEGLPAAL